MSPLWSCQKAHFDKYHLEKQKSNVYVILGIKTLQFDQKSAQVSYKRDTKIRIVEVPMISEAWHHHFLVTGTYESM